MADESLQEILKDTDFRAYYAYYVAGGMFIDMNDEIVDHEFLNCGYLKEEVIKKYYQQYSSLKDSDTFKGALSSMKKDIRNNKIAKQVDKDLDELMKKSTPAPGPKQMSYDDYKKEFYKDHNTCDDASCKTAYIAYCQKQHITPSFTSPKKQPVNPTDNHKNLPPNHEKDDNFKIPWKSYVTSLKKVLKDAVITEDKNAENFVATIEKGDTITTITASSPHDVALSATKKDGTPDIPDQKIFDSLAQKAKRDGCDINFGNIQDNEFKARLLIACLNHNVETQNAPQVDEEFFNSIDTTSRDKLKTLIGSTVKQPLNIHQLNNHERRLEMSKLDFATYMAGQEIAYSKETGKPNMPKDVADNQRKTYNMLEQTNNLGTKETYEKLYSGDQRFENFRLKWSTIDPQTGKTSINACLQMARENLRY